MISFRSPNKDDLSLINSWHQDVGVMAFYNSGDLIAEVESLDKYLPNDEGEALIIEIDALPIGLISVGVYNPSSVSIVYFIGNNEERHRGKGSVALKAFLGYADQRGWKSVNASVSSINYPSWKALLNAGFRFSGKKKNVYKYNQIKDKDFDEILLFFSKSYSNNEEEVHALIDSQLSIQKSDLLVYYEQVLTG